MTYPEAAYTFHIGGYQPAQKWLKDRRDRQLDHNDLQYYQKIIEAQRLAMEIMRKIDNG